MYTNAQRNRFVLILIGFLTLLSLLLIKLIFVQLVKNFHFKRLADRQHLVSIEIPARRGDIYDRNQKELAVTLNMNSIYAVPRDIKDKELVAGLLCPLLNLKKGFLLERLSRDKGFIWLKRQVDDVTAHKIKALKLENIGVLKEGKRFYPKEKLASHVVGFVGVDNDGLEGIELLFDRYLKGEEGLRLVNRDAKKREVFHLNYKIISPQDGYGIVLTIDEIIQYFVEKELDRALKKEMKCKGVSVVVMDPGTGEILALANRPAFDPNNIQDYPLDARRNRTITDMFEPGSVFKIITASAVLNEKVVDLEDDFFCENGEFKIFNHTLHDHVPHGHLKFREVIEKSSNIGTVKAAMRLGPERLYRYAKLYGVGSKTNVELPGETAGFIRTPRLWSKLSMTAIPMGQEVTVTVLQLACAVSAIANNGILVKPRIIKEIMDSKGETIKDFKPVALRRVMSEETAYKMKSILKGAVETGTGQKARLDGFSSAGKTGTAQKIEPNGTYSHRKFVASFIGFAPVEHPRIAIAVTIDEPRPFYYGGTVAAPIFKKIADDTLRYLNVEKGNTIAKGNERVVTAED